MTTSSKQNDNSPCRVANASVRYQHKPETPHSQLSSGQLGNGAMDDKQQHGPDVPTIFKSLPPIKDSLTTETSVNQDETLQECLPFLTGETSRSIFDYNLHGLPSLDREKHIEYLHGCLEELPAGFVGFDAARPWLVYWTLTGLCVLGESVDQYRSRYGTDLQNLHVPADWSRLQRHTDLHAPAEPRWWVWWRSRPYVTLCSFLRRNIEPGNGRWRGSIQRHQPSNAVSFRHLRVVTTS